MRAVCIRCSLRRSPFAEHLEAYPVDAGLSRSASFTGFVSTFTRAGFEVVVRRVPARPIVRRDLEAS
jgi:hypothetical protein